MGNTRYYRSRNGFKKSDLCGKAGTIGRDTIGVDGPIDPLSKKISVKMF